MRRFAAVIVLVAMFLTGCRKNPISFEDALSMDSDNLDKAVIGISYYDLEEAWSEAEIEADNINGYAFSMGNEAIIIYDDPKGYVYSVRRCWWCEGRFVLGLNGKKLVLVERNGYAEPVAVSTAKFVSFEGIENGDRVRILVEGISETYPCQAEAYGVKLVQQGSYGDLDKETMERLRELGWLE